MNNFYILLYNKYNNNMELIKNNIYKIQLFFENKKYEYVFKFDHLNKGWLYVNGYIQLYNSNIVDYSSEKNNLILDLNYDGYDISIDSLQIADENDQKLLIETLNF